MAQYYNGRADFAIISMHILRLTTAKLYANIKIAKHRLITN